MVQTGKLSDVDSGAADGLALTVDDHLESPGENEVDVVVPATLFDQDVARLKFTDPSLGCEALR